MIRAIADGKDGPLLMLGLTKGNLDRLRAGLPIVVALGSMLKQAVAETGDVPEGELSVVISYGETHVDVVQDWIDGKIPLPPDFIDQARALDEQLEREEQARRAERGEDLRTHETREGGMY